MRLSTTLSKAFATSATGPFSTGPFAYNFAANPLPDGFVQSAEGASLAPNVIGFIPFCDGPAGTLFSVRVFYWNNFGIDPSSRVFIGVPLAEFSCVVSNVAGIALSPLFDANQRLCDQIALTSGSVGLEGTIYSVGAGSDLPAMVQMEIQGARLLSFDFQAVDGNGQPLNNFCNMNAFWSKCD